MRGKCSGLSGGRHCSWLPLVNGRAVSPVGRTSYRRPDGYSKWCRFAGPSEAVRTSDHLRRWSAGPVDPLSAEEDLGGSGWEVFLDLGVMVGQDAGDVGVGLGPVVLRVAGGYKVE